MRDFMTLKFIFILKFKEIDVSPSNYVFLFLWWRKFKNYTIYESYVNCYQKNFTKSAFANQIQHVSLNSLKHFFAPKIKTLGIEIFLVSNTRLRTGSRQFSLTGSQKHDYNSAAVEIQKDSNLQNRKAF